MCYISIVIQFICNYIQSSSNIQDMLSSIDGLGKTDLACTKRVPSTKGPCCSLKILTAQSSDGPTMSLQSSCKESFLARRQGTARRLKTEGLPSQIIRRTRPTMIARRSSPDNLQSLVFVQRGPCSTETKACKKTGD